MRHARVVRAALTPGLRLQALALTGAVMGSYSIKVVRSKTAIVPVNASLLPRTEEESERCKRTVYVTNIDLGVEVRLPTYNKLGFPGSKFSLLASFARFQ